MGGNVALNKIFSLGDVPLNVGASLGVVATGTTVPTPVFST